MHQQSMEALALIEEFAYLETATRKAQPLLLPPLSTKASFHFMQNVCSLRLCIYGYH